MISNTVIPPSTPSIEPINESFDLVSVLYSSSDKWDGVEPVCSALLAATARIDDGCDDELLSKAAIASFPYVGVGDDIQVGFAMGDDGSNVVVELFCGFLLSRCRFVFMLL